MTVSVKAPTSTTGSIQLNGSDVLTIDSSGNVTIPNNLNVTGTPPTPAANSIGATELNVSGNGTSGQVLTSDADGSFSWADASGGITQGTAIATTSGNSVTFTGIPSGTKRIMVLFNNFKQNNSERVFIRIGDSGGIETTGYSDGASRMNSTTVNGWSYTTAFHIEYYSGGLYISGIVTIANVSGNTWVEGHSVGHNGSGGMVGGGYKTLSGTLDRVQVLSEFGTAFSGGSINILYE